MLCRSLEITVRVNNIHTFIKQYQYTCIVYFNNTNTLVPLYVLASLLFIYLFEYSAFDLSIGNIIL